MHGAASGHSRSGLEQAEEDVDEKNRSRCILSSPTGMGLAVFVAVMFVFIALVLWVGPDRALRAVVEFLVPAKPSVIHAIVMAVCIVVCAVLPLPILFLFLLVPGLVFGFWLGVLIIFPSLLAGACVSFLIGRYFAQKAIRGCIERGEYPKASRMLHVLESEEDSLKFLVLFRFLPIPMFIKNYGPAVLRIPFWKLAVSAIPHCFWSAVLFSSLGAVFQGTAEVMREGNKLDWKTLRWQQALIFLASLFAMIAMAVYAWRIYSRKTAEEDGATGGTGGGGGDGEPNRNCCSVVTFRCVMIWAYALVWFGCIATALIFSLLYGPEASIARLLRWLPEDPSWRDILGLGALLIVMQTFCLPLWQFLCLIAGLILGFWLGMAVLFLSKMVTAMLCIALGWCWQSGIRASIDSGCGGYTDVRRMVYAIEDDGNSLRLLTLFRFVYQPLFTRNYAPALLQVPLWKHFATCLPHCIWAAALFASLGASFRDTATLIRQGDHISLKALKWQQVAIWLAALISTPLLAYCACKEYYNKLSEEEGRPIAPKPAATRATEPATGSQA